MVPPERQEIKIGRDGYSLPGGSGSKVSEDLMEIFELSPSIDPDTKNRLRPRVWTSLTSEDAIIWTTFKPAWIIAVGALICGLVSGVILSALWARHLGLYACVGAIAVSLLLYVVTIGATFIQSLLEKLYIPSIAESRLLLPANFLAIVALDVLGLRSLPLAQSWFADWIVSGLAAGLIGSIVVSSCLLVALLLATFFEARDDRKSRTQKPEFRIVQNLIRLLGNLERLGELYADKRPSFHEEKRRVSLRKNSIHCVEEVARFVEHGLPAKLRVGDARVDRWLRRELEARAKAVRIWSEMIALPRSASYDEVVTQVVKVLECTVEENWGAIPSAPYEEREAFWKRILQALPRALMGIVPIGFLLIAPSLGLNIPKSIKDSLLTFAIPWLLLQIVQLIVPKTSDYLAQSKGVRELLPSFKSDGE